LLITSKSSINYTLDEIVKHSFPVHYRQRQEEEKMVKESDKIVIPLFLLGDLVLFPGNQLPLHVFEPRYRLMIRRCIEGSHRFGVVPFVNGKLSDIGTAAFIENLFVFPDGRSLVLTTGEERFKVKSMWQQDGYSMAEIDILGDSEDPLKKDKISDCFKKSKELVKAKFAQNINQVEEKFGKMPTDCSKFTFWLAQFLPKTIVNKHHILATFDLYSRIEYLANILDNYNLNSGCSIS